MNVAVYRDGKWVTVLIHIKTNRDDTWVTVLLQIETNRDDTRVTVLTKKSALKPVDEVNQLIVFCGHRVVRGVGRLRRRRHGTDGRRRG